MNDWGIIGHEWAVQHLRERIASGRVGHGYLFTGPAGLGKMVFATRLAQAINCTDENPPCGECRACTLIARGQHPDYTIIEPENDKIKIEAIRDLQNTLAMRPFEGKYRVAVIRSFDRASGSAMDALLKTLEEPPSQSKLILTADVGESLLPTIVSRCQVIPLRPVAASEIESGLIARGVEADQAGALARLSGGRPGWAIKTSEDPTAFTEHMQSIEALVGLLRSNRIARFNYAEELARFDRVKEVLEVWQSWFRDVMLVAEGSRVTPIHAEQMGDLQAVADQAGSEAARKALIAIRDTIYYLERNANARLTLEVMFLEMPYL